MVDPRDTRAVLLVAAGLAVGAAGVTTIGVHAHLSPDGRAANDGFLVAACLAGAAVGFTRYRSSGDTHPLFVAAGLLAIAAQTALFDQHWILSSKAQPWATTTLPAVGWFLGWLIGAIAFVLARPWWDRRGRAPLRAPLVLGVTTAALALPDLVLIVLRHSLPHAKDLDAQTGVAFASTSPLLWILGVTTIAMLGVAAWRESHPPGNAHTSRPWLSAAWSIAIGGQIAMLARSTSYRPLIAPADLLFPAVAMIALMAFLAPQRTEASHARRATDRAQEVMGGRAEIAAMIAHEVRGPVSTIRGLAGTALAHYDRLTDDERREFLGLIEQESRVLLATVTQASTALKVDAATVRYQIRAHDLGATVREGVDAADVAGHPIEADVPEGIEVTLDRRWIAEAVRQLVDNAAKFSPPEAAIGIAARADDHNVTIEVTDHGPGIPSDRRNEVFGKYANWRPDGYEEAVGSGLGLFLVRGIVDAHRGDVHIVDVPGGGTMLRVRLPREN
ncbi:MAG: sensor histidine kinase [Actinomycetota bacterium]